jgi:hypothetical protein
LRAAWLSGEKVDKCIGFDVTEDHRTFATSGDNNICPDPLLPPVSERYRLRYPLREWGFDRKRCGQIIVDAGLPLPPKSACFFCPAMKQAEIEELARTEPAYLVLALEMERLYREGKHFRGDNAFTVKAVHQQTGEVAELGLYGPDKAAVRDQFRMIYDDTARPFKYKVSVSQAVPGLGRDFAWKDHVELPVL